MATTTSTAPWFIHPDAAQRAVSHRACALVDGGALLEHAEDAEFKDLDRHEACIFCGGDSPLAEPAVEAAAAALDED